MVILGIVYHWVDYIQYLDMEKNIKNWYDPRPQRNDHFFCRAEKMPRSWKVKT
jgi:hypothetical protein